MARVTIDLPETFLFTTEIPVRASDLNYGNHLGHDSVLTIVQEARILFYRHLGFQNELSFEGPVGQVIADAAVVYRSESFLGDILVCSIAATDFTRYGFDLLYLIINKATDKEVARAKTRIVCFDYEQRKKAVMPDVLVQKLHG